MIALEAVPARNARGDDATVIVRAHGLVMQLTGHDFPLLLLSPCCERRMAAVNLAFMCPYCRKSYMSFMLPDYTVRFHLERTIPVWLREMTPLPPLELVLAEEELILALIALDAGLEELYSRCSGDDKPPQADVVALCARLSQ